LIIFGSRTRSAVAAMLTLLCHQCGNPAAHQLVKRSTWFTLFFLPVFPVGATKWSTQCTFCGQVSKVSKEEAASYQAAAPDQAGTAAPPTLPARAYGEQSSFAAPDVLPGERP
jgi:hypothetical protein